MANYLEDVLNCVLEGEDEEIEAKVQAALDGGLAASDILNNGLMCAMDIVGKKMESGEMFIPEVLLAADTMKLGIDMILPMLNAGEMTTSGKIVIGTVEGDLHDVGKNLVAMMLGVSGFEVIDIGVDQSGQVFLDTCEKEKPDIVGVSALLTTTMPAMKNTVALIKEKYSNIKVVVGGAPVTQEFATEIKADGYSDDAGSAVILCKKLIG